MGPPHSDRVTRVPPYLICQPDHFVYGAITLYRRTFQTVPLFTDWSASPRSLATTKGISVDFFSSGYLDVSVPRVRLAQLWIHCTIIIWWWLGFPIRTSPGQSLFVSSPRLFADLHVLHRLLLPRHPPYALIRLTIYPQKAWLGLLSDYFVALVARSVTYQHTLLRSLLRAPRTRTKSRRHTRLGLLWSTSRCRVIWRIKIFTGNSQMQHTRNHLRLN